MKAGFLAGAAYFAILFGAGTAFGLARVLFVSPHLGTLGGVLVELPVMMALAWVVCGWLADHLQVGPRLAYRVAMGGTAFVLFIAVEVALSLVLGGRLTEVSMNSADAWAPAVGFAAQAAACAFPLIRVGPFAVPDGQT